MPLHWFHQPLEIELAFPVGIQRFEAAPELSLRYYVSTLQAQRRPSV